MKCIISLGVFVVLTTASLNSCASKPPQSDKVINID